MGYPRARRQRSGTKFQISNLSGNIILSQTRRGLTRIERALNASHKRPQDATLIQLGWKRRSERKKHERVGIGLGFSRAKPRIRLWNCLYHPSASNPAPSLLPQYSARHSSAPFHHAAIFHTPPIHSSIHPFIHSSIHPFIHSFTHSSIPSHPQQPPHETPRSSPPPPASDRTSPRSASTAPPVSTGLSTPRPFPVPSRLGFASALVSSRDRDHGRRWDRDRGPKRSLRLRSLWFLGAGWIRGGCGMGGWSGEVDGMGEWRGTDDMVGF